MSFNVTVNDPEGDPLTYNWSIDNNLKMLCYDINGNDNNKYVCGRNVLESKVP